MRSVCHTALPGGAGFSGTGVCSSPDSFWLPIDQLGEPESAAQTPTLRCQGPANNPGDRLG